MRLVEAFIADGVRSGASDLHVEPLDGRLRLRHRIDGVLQPAPDLPWRLQGAIVSRLKILAGMSIAEKRTVQDGRIRLPVDGRELDLRAASVPTVHGESIVLRVLDPGARPPELADLGLWPDDRERVARWLGSKDGMVLVTGPTGCGKTTTLHACLQHLNEPGRKIITVEDPVEYQVRGINQVPVHAEIGLTFAAALRAILRQAPNVVMIGEIRDVETAAIALNAALTGHLVFSTLHTNDAAGAVARLLDLGAKPSLVAAALRGIVAQRLVRRVCGTCRPGGTPGPASWEVPGLPGRAAAEPCAVCGGSGFRGRLGIFELLETDEPIQELILARASGSKLRESAAARGARTLRDDGLRKATAGLTTAGEVVSITDGGHPAPPPTLTVRQTQERHEL